MPGGIADSPPRAYLDLRRALVPAPGVWIPRGASPSPFRQRRLCMQRFFLFALAAAVAAAAPARAANPVVVVDTTMGSFKIELFPDKAPTTVKNFLQYVDDKFYDGTVFHRVIPTFMIQGGGFEPGMKQKETRAPIKNES